MLAANNLVLALTMLVVGSSDAVFSLARQSYLTEAVPFEMRARAMSTLGGAGRIGVFIGPFIGAGAIDLFGIKAAYAVGAAAAAVAGLIGVFSRDLIAGGGQESHPHTAVPLATMLRSYRSVFLSLGLGITLVSAVRASRQVVIPLWAEHLGMSASATSLLYGIAGAIDMATFYPAGKVMDRKGRRWVAVPSMVLMGLSLLSVPLTHGFVTLMLVSMVLGFGNGIGAGMVMTMGADHAPAVGRPVFLGIWRQLSRRGWLWRAGTALSRHRRGRPGRRYHRQRWHRTARRRCALVLDSTQRGAGPSRCPRLLRWPAGLCRICWPGLP